MSKNPKTIKIDGNKAFRYVYNDNYYITKSGILYSVLVKGGQGSINLDNPRRVKYGTDKDGYYRVVLSDKGHHTYIKVHQLMANQFLGGYKEGLVVNHKDGNKKNNKLSNLELVTISENVRHAIKMGLIDIDKRKNSIHINVYDKSKCELYHFYSFSSVQRKFPDLSKRYLKHIKNNDVNFNLCLFEKIVTGPNVKDYYINCYYNGKLYKVFSSVKKTAKFFNKPSNSVSGAFNTKYPKKVNKYIVTFPNVSTIESIM